MIVKDWTLYYEGQEPVACQAPCTLYSVLYESGRIPDPFYGLNDQRLTALADKDCAFEAQVDKAWGLEPQLPAWESKPGQESRDGAFLI